GDEAMMRGYAGKWHRFTQPDPYDGSYDLSDPQSFNRYSYVQNDPSNFVDPSGLLPTWIVDVPVSGGDVDASTGGPPEFGTPIIRGGDNAGPGSRGGTVRDRPEPQKTEEKLS